MKAGLPILFLLALAAVPAPAQPQAPAAAPLGAEAAASLPLLSGRDLELTSPASEAVVLRKNVRIKGPLAAPLKAKKLREVPRRLWQLVNPFARPLPAPETVNVRGLSPRAWASTAGWSPGRSAFADPVTHESSLGLVSISRAH